MDNWHYTLHILILVQGFLVLYGEMVKMKIVEEPTNYGYAGAQNPFVNAESSLKMRIKPSKFSGPQHLKRLVGKCFSLINDEYRYEFCPFINITQHEQSLRWNPYSGVLGVFQEWEIKNNTFVAMVLREGDQCNDVYRSTKVLIKCGEKNTIKNMTEPHTCQYQMIFETPLVCHPHSMLVYPTLSDDLQEEWNVVLAELERGEITEQGYSKGIFKIFEKAGYTLSKESVSAVAKKALEAEKTVSEDHGKFDTLLTCTEEYKKLKAELEGVKAMLQLKQLSNVTNTDISDVQEQHTPDS